MLLNCHTLLTPDHPCELTELAKCRYCSLLQGKGSSHCSWQNLCACDCFLWKKISNTDYPKNTIISVISYASSFGIIVKPDQHLLSLPLGTILELKLPPPFSVVIRGVLLRSDRAHGLIYLWSPNTFPTNFVCQHQIQIQVNANAFWGHHHLNNAVGKHIAVVAEQNLIPPLQELCSALSVNNNIPEMITDYQDIKQIVPDTSLILLAGSENHIKQAIRLLPTCFQGPITAWVTD